MLFCFKEIENNNAYIVIKLKNILTKYSKENMIKIEKMEKKGVMKMEEKTTEKTVRETKRERFVRIAEGRTNKILEILESLGKCANPSSYEYTAKDVEKIFGALQNELNETKKKFTRTKEKGKKKRFTLE